MTIFYSNLEQSGSGPAETEATVVVHHFVARSDFPESASEKIHYELIDVGRQPIAEITTISPFRLDSESGALSVAFQNLNLSVSAYLITIRAIIAISDNDTNTVNRTAEGTVTCLDLDITCYNRLMI